MRASLSLLLSLPALCPLPLPAEPAAAPAPLPAIRVSADGHHFRKADGSPFFWLGDTAWSIFNHPQPAEVDAYLDDRTAKGFTVIQGCMVLWDGLHRANPDGQLPFVDGDPAQINEAYFKNADAIIDKVTARGLYLAILPFWTKNKTSGRALETVANPQKMKSYCKFLTARYAGKNIFWVLGGDWPGQDIGPLVAAEAAGLLEGAGTDQIMITYHPTGRQSSSFWFQRAPWLDFNSIQSGHFIRTTNFQLVADDYAKTPAKPTLDMEPAYENITDRLVKGDPAAPRITASDVRRSAYLAVFAGAAGHTYGCGEVYEFWSPDGPDPLPGWGAGLPWRESLKLPGSSQLQHLRHLIESRPMLLRLPDQTLFAATDADLPVLDRLQATRASDGSYAFVYSAAGRPFRLQLAQLTGETFAAWWFDPRTGEAQPQKSFARSASRKFTPPSSGIGNDWILILDDTAKNYPPPGQSPPATPTKPK